MTFVAEEKGYSTYPNMATFAYLCWNMRPSSQFVQVHTHSDRFFHNPESLLNPFSLVLYLYKDQLSFFLKQFIKMQLLPQKSNVQALTLDKQSAWPTRGWSGGAPRWWSKYLAWDLWRLSHQCLFPRFGGLQRDAFQSFLLLLSKQQHSFMNRWADKIKCKNLSASQWKRHCMYKQCLSTPRSQSSSGGRRNARCCQKLTQPFHFALFFGESFFAREKTTVEWFFFEKRL